jgi:hypothetical protein
MIPCDAIAGAESMPTVCPKCKSPYWNRLRQNQAAELKPLKKGPRRGGPDSRPQVWSRASPLPPLWGPGADAELRCAVGPQGGRSGVPRV